MASYAESFNKANGALGPDLTWNTPAGYTSGEVRSNRYMAPVSLSSGSALNYTSQMTDTNDQVLTMSYPVASTSGTPTMWARASSDTNAGVTLEVAMIGDNHFKWTMLVGIAGALIATNFVPGVAGYDPPATIKFVVIGARASVYVNNVLITTQTLPQVDTGRAAGVGVLYTGIGGNADAALDTFTFGDQIVNSDIPFLVANDRYSVIALADQGTTTTSAEFRHFSAHAPFWDAELSGDSQVPAYYAADELGTVVTGSIELPFVEVKPATEIAVDSVLVEFATRPTSLANDPTASIGFSGHVEGYGIPDYSRTVSGVLTSGIATSSDFSYSATNSTQDHVYWPNSRVVKLPVRLDQRVRNVRVVITAMSMVEIKRVQLLGSTFPIRVT